MKKLTKKERVMIEQLLPVGERELLLQSMWRLWQHIGSDAMQACEESGEEITNECAAEFVLDAQRLESDAQAEGNKSLLEMLSKFRELDWTVQVKFLLDRYTFA